jgi:putative heme iron utilization protein
VLSAADVEGIVTHMNDDHADALLLYARAFGGAPGAARARMLGIDAEAIDLEVEEEAALRRLRVRLAERVESPGDAQRVLVAMVGEARRQLGGEREAGPR